MSMLIRPSGAGNGPSLPELHRRLRWLALLGIAAFVLLVGRLWQLQVMRGDSYFERTRSNVVKERYLPSVRGKILDRKGAPLADNRPAFDIYATPEQVTPASRGELIRLLGLSDDEVLKLDYRLGIGRKRDKSQPIRVLEDQGRDRQALVDQALARLPGFEVRHEPYRFYPQGDLAAHVVGYMSQMTAAEADLLTRQGYDTSELVGRDGLEKAWDSYLRGKKGTERYAVDARNHRLDDKTTETLIKRERVDDAVPGANVIVTLDSDLQKIAEKAVGASSAAIVVVDVKTGKIRALVSKPSFDPNIMTGHLTKSIAWDLEHDVRKPEVDKAVRATYPPGSVFKFTTALAALEDGQATDDENMICTGEYVLSGTTFHCHGTHGKVNLIGAIQHSCDVYFWKLAERIGLDRIADLAREYGFGTPTNIGLNGDSGGRIPTKGWYEQRTRYKVGYATNAAIGQGDVEVTVLQMAMAYAALANGGSLFVPQIIERVEAADGHVISAPVPTVAHDVKIPPDALDTWRKGMWKVTNEPGGTAYDHGHFLLVPIMGKTGTAEVKKHHKKEDDDKDLENWHPNASHAWFAGWAPAEDPEIAIVVFVEHGGSGGRIAWPIAERVLEGYFTKIHPVPADGTRPAYVVPLPGVVAAPPAGSRGPE